MNIKHIVSVVSLSAVISLFISAPVFALSISPAKLIIDPAVIGQKRIVQIAVGRMDSSTAITLESKITGTIEGHLRVVNPEALSMSIGKTGVTIPLEVDVTGLSPDTTLTGRIEFSEKGAAAKNGVPANLSNAASNVIIKVSDTDVVLLEISNYSTEWNVRESRIDMHFTVTNLRSSPAHISKLKYAILPIGSIEEPELREVAIDGVNLAPGESGDVVTSLDIDKDHVGSYNFVLDFIDEQGRVFLTKDVNGMTFHHEIVRRRIITKRLLYVGIGALLIAAAFFVDHRYVKRKYGKKM